MTDIKDILLKAINKAWNDANWIKNDLTINDFESFISSKFNNIKSANKNESFINFKLNSAKSASEFESFINDIGLNIDDLDIHISTFGDYNIKFNKLLKDVDLTPEYIFEEFKLNFKMLSFEYVKKELIKRGYKKKNIPLKLLLENFDKIDVFELYSYAKYDDIIDYYMLYFNK